MSSLLSFIRKLPIILFFALITGTCAIADELSPDAVIGKITADVLESVQNDRELRAGNREKVLALAEAKVLPHMDFARLTRLATGKHWREATPSQRDGLMREFRRLLIHTYSNAIGAYKGQTLVVEPLHMEQGDTDVEVHSKYLRPGAAPLSVEYSMGKTAEGWKVYDIAIEGVSLVMTYRTEFSEEIKRSGLNGLVAKLQEKNLQTTRRTNKSSPVS
ncbi:MAG: ABC transporter substrate-binding protein [Pseudomonadota bacterium]